MFGTAISIEESAKIYNTISHLFLFFCDSSVTVHVSLGFCKYTSIAKVLTRNFLCCVGNVLHISPFFFFCDAVTQRGSWPPHS